MTSHRILLVAVFIVSLTSTVRADGGFVLWQRTSGSITVTAFTSQSPLRKGPADISFLVESTDELRPILDARVFIALENSTGVTVRTEATHAQARNKLLYCSLIDLSKAGHWKMSLVVMHAGERDDFVGDLTVGEPQSTLIAYWKLIAFPALIIVVFMINQYLRPGISTT